MDRNLCDRVVAESNKKGLIFLSAYLCRHHAWSPDGQYFVACVLSPRIRVDNGFKIFDYKGSPSRQF